MEKESFHLLPASINVYLAAPCGLAGYQVCQCAKGITRTLPLGQQFIENPRIGLTGGMQQHDGPVMYPRKQLGECLLIGRLIIRIPVHIRERPENRGIPQLLRLPEILLAELALRRTIKFLHRLTGQRGVFLLKTVQLRRKRALIRNAGHIRMVQRVIAHNMPFCGHALYEIRCGINKVSHHEKAGRRVMLFERIQNKPEFRAFKHGDVTIPTYSPEDLKKVSVGAGVLLGGLSGAALGTAGGFAAAGATTAAVMALGTASTGTAIASLSGAAATNATLAALGGGALAAGGGGIALGTTILGATTLGMGLLVGGIIFNFTGNKLSAKADEAMEQMKKAKTEIDRICAYLESLHMTEERFEKALSATNNVYMRHLAQLGNLVILTGKTDWNEFTDSEKLMTENTVQLVALLFQMCKVQLVLSSGSTTEVNRINQVDIDLAINSSDAFLKEKGLTALT